MLFHDIDTIFIVNENLELIIKEKYNNNNLNFTSFFNSVDINHDGTLEIYSGTQKFNKNGILIFDGGVGGCNSVNMAN